MQGSGFKSGFENMKWACWNKRRFVLEGVVMRRTIYTRRGRVLLPRRLLLSEVAVAGDG